MLGSTIFLMVVVLTLLWGIAIYNRLVAMRRNVRQAWANISISLRQRHDELVKLADVVKRYAEYEPQTLERLIRARQQVETAIDGGDARALAEADREVRRQRGALLAVAEAHPELKADGLFRDLMDRVASLEGQISDRRELYNEAVTLLNTGIEQFPDMLIARPLGFTYADILEFSAEETPDVDLGKLLAGT